MDTGSSLVWFPCTQSYACSSCNFEGVDPTNVTTFVPELSSSTKIVGCRNRKCRWLFPNVECRDCGKNSIGCDDFCPSFTINYGSGAPAGIAGFGRGPESLPSQMMLKRFSYCLVSHQFDDAPVASDLVLVSRGGAANVTGGRINYTPFHKITNTSNPAFKEYYYVSLRKITVGGVDIMAPYEFLVPDSAGNGGTIVDSGTTFTFMENPVFELVAREFEKQVGKNYSRATEVEDMSGLRPCFNVSDENSLSLPQLSFHFKGGAKLALPLGDYFSFMADSVVCMTVNTNNGGGGGVGPGPAIIFGNYQQQNIYMEYDLENERLGFRKQFCR
ncbi:hypothetical protein DH2020_014889 [Rehmannia glutinosa]|uniref:Peptidase A1 domain-containing protein n=1 Tax=Rehmannia glutinosa TaxID=99300 RepID=A0ABR0X198_REHGL